MNHIYRIVFNRATGVRQAVSETAVGGQGGAATSTGDKSPALPRLSQLASACALAVMALAGGSAFAAPFDGGGTAITGAQGATGTSVSKTGQQGAAGVTLPAQTTGTNAAVITGGKGGSGFSNFFSPGAGGRGGVGVSSGTAGSDLTNTNKITGGAGGDAGSALVAGGVGGVGVALTAPTTFTNSGTVSGGKGGGLSNGGVGLTATGGSTIVNSGTISGGANLIGNANAIELSGGGNKLELRSGSQINGNVVATAAGGDTLALGGTANSSLNVLEIGDNAKYRNFSNFEKNGTSTWTLTGLNLAETHWNVTAGTLSIGLDLSLGAVSGGLTLNGGTLQTTNNITTARNITLGAAGGTLDTNRTLNLSGTVSGEGALTKTGTGTVVLTGTNTYGGGTTISGGTLQLGNGGTTGSITGNVTNNGTLAINRSNAADIDGVISGTGAVHQDGSGTTTLKGVNTYTGGTVISNGTLAGNVNSFGSGAITNNANLAIDQSADGVLDNDLSGTGKLSKTGAGQLSLQGNVNLTGGATVTDGSLLIGADDNTGANLTGRTGANGSAEFVNGGNAAAGSAALALSGTATGATNHGTLTGGAGGVGGAGGNKGGAGGTGGAGFSNSAAGGASPVAFVNAGHVVGGNGGAGGNGFLGAKSVGGAGGTGVDLTAATTVTNQGSITGGNGGVAGSGSGTAAVSAGGVGLKANGGSNIINNGSISGGLSSDGTRADAVQFTGGGNRLELQALSVINGNVVATAAGGDTLALGGAAAQSFDTAQVGTKYQNFSAYEKTGSGTSTLMGSTTAVTPWTVREGVLSISQDASLGDVSGKLTLDGGTLSSTRTTTSNRNIVLGAGNGTLDVDIYVDADPSAPPTNTLTVNGVVSGPGSLTKQGTGTLILNAINTYAGGTNVNGGTVEANTTGALGTGAVKVNLDSALLFTGNAQAGTLAISTTRGTGQPGANSGLVKFNDTSSADHAQISNEGNLEFRNQSTAGNATINNTNRGGSVFYEAATAGASSITNSGGGETLFWDDSSAGTATLTNNAGGTIEFADNSSGDTATVHNNTGGRLIIDSMSTPGVAIGSVEGDGAVFLGRKKLTTGGLNTSTTISGVISGNNGSLDKVGTGTLTLTGANTYTGGTTVSGGTLQIGNGGTTGSIQGNVVNNAALAFNRSDAVAFNGAISGTGTVTQAGAGNLTLGGVNTYSGGTTIASGTVTGATTSFGSGGIVNNGSLIIDQAADGTLANAVSGTGEFAKRGTGLVKVTGDMSGFTGDTQVTNGALSVNGVLGGKVNVFSGASLKGTGTVGSTVVQAGGTIAPGNSIGTLNVNGNLTLAPGATYEVEVAADGTSDLIHATGTATVQGASVLALAANGNWQQNTNYTILTADSGVFGQFGGVTTNMAFLEAFLAYDATNVGLRLQRNDASFQSVGFTANQRAAGAGVESLHTGALYTAVVQLSAANARSAFDQLSGEAHASLRSSLVDDSRFVREASNDRLRQAFGATGASTDMKVSDGSDGTAAWARTFGSWGHTDGDGNAAYSDRSVSGVLLGADRNIGDWRVGVSGGASQSRFGVGARQSSATVDSYHLGLYGGTQLGELSLRTGLNYSRHDIDTRRSVAFTGVANTLEAGYHAATTQAFGELGWRIDSGAVALEPFANLAYVNLRTDGFTERGGIAALTAGSSTTDTTFSTLGLRASTGFDMRGTSVTARGLVGWRHAFGDTTQTTRMTVGGGAAFGVAGVPIAKNAAVLEAGLDFSLRQDLTLGVSYTGQMGGDAKDHGLKASLLWKF